MRRPLLIAGALVLAAFLASRYLASRLDGRGRP